MRKEKLPPLNALRAFEAAARHGSLSKGADELAVTHGAVSRQVAKLEDYLGVTLFTRGHQNVTLTKVGASYAQHLERLFDQLREITNAHFENQRNESSLRIGVLSTFGIRFLIPKLARFKQTYPNLSLQVETSATEIDPEDPNMDVVIWRGDGHWRDVHSVRLFKERMIAVGSPSLVSESEAKTAESLKTLPFLHAVKGPMTWQQWLQAAGVAGIQTKSGLCLEYSWQTYQGAAHGLGLALAVAPFVREDIEGGRFVQILDAVVDTGLKYYAVTSKEKPRYPAVVHFTEWLADEGRHSET